VLTKAVALLINLAVATGALALTLILGGALVHIGVSPTRLLAAAAMTAVLAVPFGGIALAAGSISGRRGLAAAAGIGIAVFTYLIAALAELADWLRPARIISPFHLASPADLLSGNPNLLGLLATLLTAGILLIVAAFTLQRRDLSA